MGLIIRALSLCRRSLQKGNVGYLQKLLCFQEHDIDDYIVVVKLH